jgi:hypothetical protein
MAQSSRKVQFMGFRYNMELDKEIGTKTSSNFASPIPFVILLFGGNFMFVITVIKLFYFLFV